MKESNIMFTLAAGIALTLPAFDILTGEALNVFLLSFVPAGMAAAMGGLIRYMTKTAKVEVEVEA